MTALDNLRHKASYGATGLLWVNVAILCAVALTGHGTNTVASIIGCALLAATATMFWLRDKAGPTTRVVNAMALAAQVGMLVYAFSGSAYQIDMHMYFFATLAITAAWVDWRAIIAYAALVAVHHLVLYVAVPAAVFPGQSDFGRVLLHAMILILQSGVLIALTGAVVRSFDMAANAADSSIAAHKQAAVNAEQAQKAGEKAAAERAAREVEKAEEARRIELAVDSLAGALEQLSVGNLSHRIALPLHGRMDGLRLTFNASLEKLEQALNEVGHAARSVRHDAAAISGSNQELASRTERQAVSVEETASALSQISGTVEDTAKLAVEVDRLVGSTKNGAERSATIVATAVEAMSRIEDSSRQISQIIGVIDEIAFQTNLLALNAGVEAARAGDAGKGFAVVAQEVRELAQRSATAAKEIKTLINASHDQVQRGVDLVGQTGQALKAIETEVHQISSQVQLIVHAARDQSGGIRDINGTIDQIDQNTQHNATMVQESTAAVHSLAQEAAALENLLAKFTLNEAAGGHGHMPERRRAA
ncbi:methyl-accepting chemotaxis protein [Rhizobium sp. KVB221]|uniref:Methyl-accepting chemotaxis protein n=1 Tax=Rhizobium setariae TaxID=2801340 RepID=A0A936YRX3_9HYPH|nr:methyl-accepting chemotaxis protein [Rhizobium setariae]MBL0371250.1 methyl-accepting chemotaxis protein [Rhizobium setariae]